MVQNLAKSLQLTFQIDACAFCKSLSNQVVPFIYCEVDEWCVKQCDLLIAHITSINTDPCNPVSGESIFAFMHDLNKNIHKWTDTSGSKSNTLQDQKICHKACKNMANLWAKEMVFHCIAACYKEIDQQVDDCLDVKAIKHCKVTCLTELNALANKAIVAKEARLIVEVLSKISSLCHAAKVRLLNTKDDLKSHSLSLVICLGKGIKPSPISSQTHSKGKTQKIAINLNGIPPPPTDDKSDMFMATRDEQAGSPTPVS
jgi:hypothetical protein